MIGCHCDFALVQVSVKCCVVHTITRVWRCVTLYSFSSEQARHNWQRPQGVDSRYVFETAINSKPVSHYGPTWVPELLEASLLAHYEEYILVIMGILFYSHTIGNRTGFIACDRFSIHTCSCMYNVHVSNCTQVHLITFGRHTRRFCSFSTLFYSLLQQLLSSFINNRIGPLQLMLECSLYHGMCLILMNYCL